ncbi:MAG: DUF1467 family protein [Pseudomonadota bacterium]
MEIVSGLVLYAVTWWMVFFVILPLRLVTQGEDGHVVPGTPSSAPANLNMRRKIRLTTIWATVIWAILATIIITEFITVRDFDVMDRLEDVPQL